MNDVKGMKFSGIDKVTKKPVYVAMDVVSKKRYVTKMIITMHDFEARLQIELNQMFESGYKYSGSIVSSPVESVLIFEKI
jgi:hypothetical protein